MDFVLGPFAWITAALSIVGWARTIKSLRTSPSPTSTAGNSEWRGDIVTGLIMITGSVCIIGWMIGKLLSMLLSANFALVLVVSTGLAAAQLALGILTIAQATARAYATIWLDNERDT